MFARSLKTLVNGVALATAATIILAHPTKAQAHRGFEMALALGAFAPTAQLPAPFFFGCPAIKPPPAYCLLPIIPERQRTAVAVGGRVTTPLRVRHSGESPA